MMTGSTDKGSGTATDKAGDATTDKAAGTATDKTADAGADKPADVQTTANQDPAPKAAETPKTSKARKVGPPKGEAVASDPAALFEAIKGAETAEVVFSDGENEIVGIPAIKVDTQMPGKITGAGLLIATGDVDIHGPSYGSPPYQVAGYGLFLDGEQAAYAIRPEVMTIGANMTVRISNDVVF